MLMPFKDMSMAVFNDCTVATPIFLKEKRRLNGVFPFSQSQGIEKTPFIVSNGPVYRLFY